MTLQEAIDKAVKHLIEKKKWPKDGYQLEFSEICGSALITTKRHRFVLNLLNKNGYDYDR